MSQSVGWIKLHRNLRNSFSDDKKLNIELWMLYVFLAEQATWDSFDDLGRGQIKIKASEIQREIFPNMYLKRVRHLISILRENGYIKTTQASHDNKQGLLIEVCQYDSFSGEKHEKRVRQSLDSGSTVVRQSILDNIAESFDNNHVELTGLDSTWTVPGQSWNSPGCSYYIEERNKEEKEEKEEFNLETPHKPEDANNAPQRGAPQIDSGSLNLDLFPEMKVKPKKPKAKKRQRVTPSHHIFTRIFMPDPEFVNNTFYDKSAVYFAVDQMIEEHGDVAHEMIKLTYDYYKSENQIGKQPFSMKHVEMVIQFAIDNYSILKENKNAKK